MKEEFAQYLEPTRMLDFTNADVLRTRQHLLSFETSSATKLKKLYTFVSSIKLGYNKNDTISASHVLKDGYGQCNTKVTLLMALARSAGIPCRVHCYKISREAQRNRIPSWLFFFAPKETLFTWPDFYIEGAWQPLQKIVHVQSRPWESCPFDGAAWQLEPLRSEWVLDDQGVWSSQDAYFRKHSPSVHGWRSLGWHVVGRRFLNKHQQHHSC